MCADLLSYPNTDSRAHAVSTGNIHILSWMDDRGYAGL